MVPSLDDVLVSPHHREQHHQWVPAPPEAAWDRLSEITTADLPVTRALFAVRTLPARLSGRARHARPDPAGSALIEHLPIPIQAQQRPVAVVLAGVGQPWRPRGGARPPLLDLAGFTAFDEPGWVKVAMDVRLQPVGGGTDVTTETRVRATDERTRRRFRAYWTVVRAGSGLIRRDLLRALASSG